MAEKVGHVVLLVGTGLPEAANAVLSSGIHMHDPGFSHEDRGFVRTQSL